MIQKMKKEEESQNETGDNMTRYGEFITSYFAWLPLSTQKEKTEELENISESKNKRNSRR